MRKAVGAAVYLLPSREQFISQLISKSDEPTGGSNGVDSVEIEKLAAQCIPELNKVHKLIEDAYTEYKLHDLP